MCRCVVLTLLLALVVGVQHISAQALSNLRMKKVATSGEIKLDTLSIVPHTFFVIGYDSTYYNIDNINATITWKKKPAADSVSVSYRVFHAGLNNVAQRFSTRSMTPTFSEQAILRNANNKDNNLFNFGNIEYNGSFGRSVSFGNSQDAVFNSQLNMRMRGYIGDSIQLSAAITDNNIPIQPDGTTQQIDQFDQILLQFKKKNWEVNLGDIDFRTNDSYFLNFYKRLQGLSYLQKWNIGKKINSKTIFSGAIARGKFARNILAVTDGNQGPYPLQGNNNEVYFVVLAGTEKVFIDGVQMQRGEDQDYTINYNTAQITFMPRQMITKDKRVQVEFEYSDQSYLSSMFFLSNETKFGNKFTLLFSAYQNADSKNSPINQTLNSDQMQFLANIGDSIQNAYYPAAGIDTAFSPTKILYKKIDTVYNNIHDSIFVYSTDSSVAKYNLSFAQVGANKGNYVPLASAANGIAYQWVAPVNNVPQGSFEPAQFLITPKKLVVYSLAGAYQLNNKTLIKTELASSNYNVNTFSELGKKNDIDYAGKIDIAHTEKWQTSSGKKYTMLVNAGYEGVGKYFQPVERLRAVEFYRDWGMAFIPAAASEKLLPIGFQLNDNKNNSLKYNFVRYVRGDGFTGYQNVFSHSLNTKNGWQTKEILSLTNMAAAASDSGYKGFYVRPTIDINKTFQKFHNYAIGASYAMERNDIKYTSNDSAAPQSFAFETIGAYIKSDIKKRNNWSFSYFTRTNQLPYGKNLVETDRSNNYNLTTEFMKNPKEQLRVNISYRQLIVKNDSIINQKSNNSLLGRVEYLVREWKGFLAGNVLYEIGGGQEQKRAYSYIQVPAGTGQFVWIDYNHDGIAQLNEFEPAAFSDQGNYIKIFTPTNEYVNANYTQFNYSLTLNPKMLFDAKEKLKGWRDAASRLYLQSSLQTNKKQISAGGPTFNPLQGKAADTSILNLSYIMNTTLSYNRTSPVWSGDITNMINNGKALLTYGTQETHINQWIFHGRFTIARAYTFEMQQKQVLSSLITPAFNNQNYIFNISSSLPAISYTKGTKYRLQLGYEYTVNKNALEYGGEKAITNAFNFEAKYNAVQNTSLLGRFTFNNINFTGTENTAISYNMLNGLQSGRNLLWTINFTKRLFNNLELSIQYEGRKPGDTRVINTGTASIRAVL